jgi:hypothetical protein
MQQGIFPPAVTRGTMSEETGIGLVREIMLDFARVTGLEPVAPNPRRYLWTDAFAVCNFLELFRRTGDPGYRDLALRLVDQVHRILGQHREDDPRTGWISGLDETEGELHPTRGGLRIGKPRNERGPGEPPDDRLEWDQDGQYYHYLTKWMHALSRVSRVTGDPRYTGWAVELAKTAHNRFTYVPPSGGQKRMYWKMSIDLTRPLVPSMGLHDPLDGLVTYAELQMTVSDQTRQGRGPDLTSEISEMAKICHDRNFATDDPLGIGGLMADAYRIAGLVREGGFRCPDLLESVAGSARRSMEYFSRTAPFRSPAAYRLAFRELGLSIGLHAIRLLADEIERDPGLFTPVGNLIRDEKALMRYLPLADTIEQFWLEGRNREAETWKEHREINMVMLATSLAPAGFLEI